MRSAVLSLAVALVTGALLFCSNPALADAPPVDERRDIIVGETDAPHTLLVYLSPGCTHCLDLQGEIIPNLVRNHVTPGDLRLVYRLLPSIISTRRGDDVTVDDHARALSMSRFMAGALRCSYDEGGQAAFFESLAQLVILYVRDEMREVQPDFQWPYGDAATSRLLWDRYLERSAIDAAAYDACIADGRQDRILSIFEEDRVAFDAAGYTSLPALFLDGAPVSTQGSRAQIAEAIARQLSEQTSNDADAEFEACRRREAGIRLGVHENDIEGLVAGINNPAARPGPYRSRGGGFWSNVADAWQRAAWTCGRY